MNGRSAHLQAADSSLTLLSEETRSIVDFRLVSTLPLNYRNELENLFFFNPRQYVVRERVVDLVMQFGKPHIALRGGGIGLEVERLPQAQALFLVHGAAVHFALLAVVVCHRNENCFEVIYLALKHGLNGSSCTSNRVLLFLLRELRHAAGRVKGIESVVVNIDGKHRLFPVY